MSSEIQSPKDLFSDSLRNHLDLEEGPCLGLAQQSPVSSSSIRDRGAVHTAKGVWGWVFTSTNHRHYGSVYSSCLWLQAHYRPRAGRSVLDPHFSKGRPQVSFTSIMGELARHAQSQVTPHESEPAFSQDPQVIHIWVNVWETVTEPHCFNPRNDSVRENDSYLLLIDVKTASPVFLFGRLSICLWLATAKLDLAPRCVWHLRATHNHDRTLPTGSF